MATYSASVPLSGSIRLLSPVMNCIQLDPPPTGGVHTGRPFKVAEPIIEGAQDGGKHFLLCSMGRTSLGNGSCYLHHLMISLVPE